MESYSLKPIEKTEQDTESKENRDPSYLNTIFNKIEPGDEGNNLRIECFNKLSPNMKEALSQIGSIFKDIKNNFPWAIHGSTALVLEGETSKKPVDIDLAFGKPDFEKVFEELKKLENANPPKIRNLKTMSMKNFNDEENGCTKIIAEIKTGEGQNEKWIEIEAFAQNVDPEKPRNGITNPGLDKTGINIYNEKGTEINFADRKENLNFYLQVAYTELQKYQLDNRFMHVVKNKFPQRLQNIISIIKREEKEEFERKLKKKEVTEAERPDIENIKDEHIRRLIEEFAEHNTKNETLKLNDFAHSKVDPVKVITETFNEFLTNKYSSSSKTEKNGFVSHNIKEESFSGREEVVDKLTESSLKDMEGITKLYNKLNVLNDSCKGSKECDRSSIISTSTEIFKTLNETKTKYEDYLEIISFEDNRDFIPYVSIKTILNEFINPAIELAIVTEEKIEKLFGEIYV